MSTNNGGEAQLAQCQAYVRNHKIQQIVKEAIVNLCIHKPENPVLFLKNYFSRLHDQQKLSQVFILNFFFYNFYFLLFKLNVIFCFVHKKKCVQKYYKLN